MAGAVPRNFKLLDELEEAEKGAKGGADISLGLDKADDTFMTNWNASVFASLGGGEPRLITLSIVCGDAYPTAPPAIKFISKVNMDCVDAKGNVVNGKVPYLASWNTGKTMHGALAELKQLMARAPRQQPADGVNF